MLYYLYQIGIALARSLPIKISYKVAETVATGYYYFAVRDKESMKDNLRVVLGDDTSRDVLNRHIRKVYKNFAKYLVDFFRFSKFSEMDISDSLTVRGIENLDELLDKKKGAILVTLHLGNWELGGAIVGGLGYPLNAIALEHKDKKINDFFVQQRGVNNLKTIPIGVQIKDCFRALRQNEILAIVGDKDYTNNGIEVDFFGKKACLPKGPAAFAIKTGAPISFCVILRNEDDTFTLQFEDSIYCQPTGNMEEDMKTLMGKYIKYFEKYIRKYPDQWYAFEKIWKQEQIIR